MGGQLSLGGGKCGHDDHVDVIVYDRWGRVVDVIPAHLGDRHATRGRASVHGATLFGYLAIRHAEQLAPTWATLPGHEAPAPGTSGAQPV